MTKPKRTKRIEKLREETMKKTFLFGAAVIAPLMLGGLAPVHAQGYPTTTSP